MPKHERRYTWKYETASDETRGNQGTQLNQLDWNQCILWFYTDWTGSSSSFYSNVDELSKPYIHQTRWRNYFIKLLWRKFYDDDKEAQNSK